MWKWTIVWLTLTVGAHADALSVRKDIAPFGIPDVEAMGDTPAELLTLTELGECLMQFDALQRERAEVNVEQNRLLLEESIEKLSAMQKLEPKEPTPKNELDRQLDDIEKSLSSGPNSLEAKTGGYLRRRMALEVALNEFGPRCALKRYRTEDLRVLLSEGTK